MHKTDCLPDISGHCQTKLKAGFKQTSMELKRESAQPKVSTNANPRQEPNKDLPIDFSIGQLLLSNKHLENLRGT